MSLYRPKQSFLRYGKIVHGRETAAKVRKEFMYRKITERNFQQWRKESLREAIDKIENPPLKRFAIVRLALCWSMLTERSDVPLQREDAQHVYCKTCRTCRRGRGQPLQCGLQLLSTTRHANLDGPARPLGYLRAETPTRGEPAGPFTPGPPWKEGLPAGEGCADTGSAGSVDINSGSPRAATIGLTVSLVGVEEVAAGATSLGSTSLHSLGRGAFDRV